MSVYCVYPILPDACLVEVHCSMSNLYYACGALPRIQTIRRTTIDKLGTWVKAQKLLRKMDGDEELMMSVRDGVEAQLRSKPKIPRMWSTYPTKTARCNPNTSTRRRGYVAAPTRCFVNTPGVGGDRVHRHGRSK